MTATDLAALVGALAWAPPIISAIRSWLTTPTLRIITQPTPETGYTSLGPILNLRLAFTVKHQDIVITGIKLKLLHESGEELTFAWRGIIQRMGQFNYPQMGMVPFEKELNVLAMKVAQKDIEERFIRFQALSFLEKKARLEAIANKKLAWHRQNDTLNVAEFMKNQEMMDIYENARQSFNWKPGNYRLSILIDSPDSFKLHGNEYEFTVSALQTQELSSNLNQIEKSYLHEINPPKGQSEEGKQVSEDEVNWKWVYPDMYELKNKNASLVV